MGYLLCERWYVFHQHGSGWTENRTAKSPRSTLTFAFEECVDKKIRFVNMLAAAALILSNQTTMKSLLLFFFLAAALPCFAKLDSGFDKTEARDMIAICNSFTFLEL